jgi:valyl-tRNA synthetase
VARSTAAVETGEIRFYPERWQKTYTHWMHNIRDWCISRQLWWGHRIPVWYRGDEIYCGIEPPPGDGWTQDPDVLDTWFSSWLWPFATMDEPTRKTFYPTTDLVTGPDIIFFWVARMIMAGYEFTGQKPFANVYFTGIIRDAQGRKMSKSLGNSPDPLDLIAKYGADGLRFGLMLIAPQGQDILFDEKRCETGRNFMNKLWNAARFIQMQQPGRTELNAHDRRILYEMNDAIATVSAALDAYRFNEAAKELYDFVWGDFCDWYIEASKISPNLTVLRDVFTVILRLLHPFAPFITEELWRSLTGGDTIQFAPWPVARPADTTIVAPTNALYAVVTAGRQLRNDHGLDPKKKARFVIAPSAHADFFRAEIPFLTGLLNAEAVTIDPGYTPTGLTPSLVTPAATVFLVGAVDPVAEKARLTKQLDALDAQIAGVEAKLANENFLAKAAPIAVQRERDKLAALRDQRAKVATLLQAVG